MSINLIGDNILPNTYIEKIRIFEGHSSTTVFADIVAFDFKTQTESMWFQHNNFRKYMRINACLLNEDVSITSDKSLIGRINNAEETIPTKRCVSKSILNNYEADDFYDESKSMYKYSLSIRLSGKLKKNCFLYTFFSLNVERMEQELGAKLSSSKNEIVTGTVASEIVKMDGDVKNTTKIYYIENTQEIWTGPVHKHINDQGQEIYMAGESHVTTPHPVLNPVETENTKIMFYGEMKIPNIEKGSFDITDWKKKTKDKKLLRKLKQRNKKRDFRFHYEMDGSVDDDKNLHKIFIIDLCNALLRKSFPARELFRLNPALFMEVGKTLSLDYLSIKRKKLPNNKTSMEHDVVSINNPNDVIAETEFFINSRGKVISNPQDGKDKYRKVSLIKQMQAGLPNQQMALYMVDYQGKSLATGHYSYVVDIIIKDKIYSYIEGVLKKLQKLHNDVSSLRADFIVGKKFDVKSNSAKKGFLVNYFNYYGIILNEKTGLPMADSTANSNLENAFFVRGLDALEEGCGILGFDVNTDLFMNKINPLTATPESLFIATRDIENVIKSIEGVYRVNANTFKGTKQSSGRTSSPKTKNIVKLSFYLKPQKIINKANIGYKFIKMPKTNKTFKLSKRLLKARANTEVKKYFKEKPKDVGKILNNVPKTVQAAIANVDANSFVHFTPQSIKIDNIEIDTSTVSPQSTNLELFQTLSVSREVGRLESDPMLSFNLSLLEREEEGEITISADDIMGRASPFIEQLVDKIKYRPSALRKNKKQLNRISSTLFHGKKAIKDGRKPKSLSMFNPESHNNIFTDGLATGKLKPSQIPIQIRSLMLSKSSAVKNNFIKEGDDIFDNHESNEVAQQHFTNIKKLKFIDKFPIMKNGLFDMSLPVLKEMTDRNFDNIKGTSKLCVLETLEDASVGVGTEEDDFNAIGSFFVLEDEGYQEPTSFSMENKSKVAKHSKKIFSSAKKNMNLFSTSNTIKQNPMNGGIFKKAKATKKVSIGGVFVSKVSLKTKPTPLKEIEAGLHPVGNAIETATPSATEDANVSTSPSVSKKNKSKATSGGNMIKGGKKGGY